MAVQLSQPQGAYFCGFCSFTSPDHRILVKHLVDHALFKEKKHEHVLWCGLCKPSMDANCMDCHQQGMRSENSLIGSVYYGNNDLGYGDTDCYYSGYNGLYNPYAYPDAYHYPMNIAYRNPCFENVSGYYQTRDTFFYTDYFYERTDISPYLNTSRFLESQNKDLLHASHSDSIQYADSNSKMLVNTVSNFGVHSQEYNSGNYESSIQTLPSVQNSTENSPDKFLNKETIVCEASTLSKNTENDDWNVQKNEFGTISNIGYQSEINRSDIQPKSYETLARKSSVSQVKMLSSKEIPDSKLNAVKRSQFQMDARKADDGETLFEDLTESSNLKFLPKASSKGICSIVVDAKSADKTNSVNIDANTRAITAPSENYSKIQPAEVAKLSENNVQSNKCCTEQLISIPFPEAVPIEKIVLNDASNVKNCTIDVKVDTCSKSSLRKKSNSKLHTYEREKSENFIGNSPVPAQDLNAIPVSDAESSPKVTAPLMTEDILDLGSDSAEVDGPLKRTDLNDVHWEQPTSKFETLPKNKNSISMLSENENLLSEVKLSPKIKVRIIRENSVSDIQTRSICLNADLKAKEDKMLGRRKRRQNAFEKDTGREKKDNKLKMKTCEYAFNQNSHRESKDNSTEEITEDSKIGDNTGAFPYVECNLRNGCRSDFNFTNYRSATPQDQVRSTYAEVLKRGRSLKSCN